MGGDAEHPQFNSHQLQISSLDHPHNTGGGRFHFPVGSLVEVRTDEEDFKGVYFSATVIPPSTISPKKSSRKKPKKLYVEYHNLLAHEDGSDRLREYVDVSFVRPAPPLQEIVKGFEQDDVVDAFYKDGWWTGVVTRVVEGGERFVVTFQNPPDELEFGLAELRVHWDWVSGSWVRPQKQSIAGLMFDVGRKVEVSFDREDFQDAWFPATILEDLGGTFLVEYISASTDNKDQPIKARVNFLHVRPCPPLLKDKNFVLLDKVDAFFDFGWWSGVITKELENSRYIVYFKQMKLDKEFNQSELRPHMEWKDGKWFTSSQEASIPSSDDGMHEHHTTENSGASAATAPVNNLVDRKDTCDGKTPSSLTSWKGHLEQLTPDNQRISHVTTSLPKRRQYLSDSGGALSQPLKKLKEGDVVGANQQDGHDRSIKEVLCGLDFVNNMETSATQTTGDQSSCNPSWGKKVRRKQRNIGATQNVRAEIQSTFSSMKKSSTQMLPLASLELDVLGKEPDAAGNIEEAAQNEHAKEDTELPIIIGLPCTETGSSEFGISGGKRSHRSNSKETVNDQKQQLDNSTIQKMKDSEQSETGEFREKRKRGRPRKILVESIQTPGTGNALDGGVGSGDLNRKDDDSQRISEVVMMGMEASMSDQEKVEFNKEKVANGPSDTKNRKVRITKRTLPRVHEEKGVPLKRGRRRIASEKIAVQVQDSLDAAGGKMMEVNRTVEVEKVVDEVPSNEFDDEPLSKWIEEMHTPSVIDGSRLSSVGTLEQCMANGEKQRDGVTLDEDSEKQPESGRQASALVDIGSIVPFVKNTVGVVLDEDSEKQPESGTQASALVDKGSIVPSEPQSLSSAENTVGVVLDENSEKQPESGTQASALVDKVSIVPSEPPSLPFVKNTVLWKTIESMEVFQKIPQKPHFQPLEHFKESSREGLAIGYMVTFSSVVEKTSRLQFNDPKSIIDDIMETLEDLERHGFDVKVVQDCVTELLAVKDKEEKLVDEVNNLNSQISEHNHKKTRIEEEIQEINEQIRKLQEKVSLAESEKEKEDDEIASVQARLKETEENIKNVRGDFEGIVSSIL